MIFLRSDFPLAVKLGTISGDGKADVYSYAEDDMVEDPLLKQHLAHFGINMEGMKKVSNFCYLQTNVYSKILLLENLDGQVNGRTGN